MPNTHPDRSAVVAKAKADLLAAGRDISGPCGAFAIVSLAAWRLHQQGDSAGLLSKPAGNNCQGFAVDIIAYPDGAIFDVLVGSGVDNTPAWNADPAVDPSLYRPPVEVPDPAAPAPAPAPTPAPTPSTSPSSSGVTDDEIERFLTALEKIADGFDGFVTAVSELAKQLDNVGANGVKIRL